MKKVLTLKSNESDSPLPLLTNDGTLGKPFHLSASSFLMDEMRTAAPSIGLL